MNRNSSPIGLFDSGVGGLTVLNEIAKILPQENIVYLGDTARMPYGNKSPETVLSYALEGASFLLEKEIKLLIVACHTASSYALETLKKQLPIPVIGVIQPGFELLMQSTKNIQVAILGTEGTIRSGVYQNLILQHHPEAVVFPVACPLFAPMIEEGLIEHPSAKLIADHYLSDLRNSPIDAALLACTHYPLIRPLIQEALGDHVKLIEPAETCALQAREWLTSSSLLNRQIIPPIYQIYSTDNPFKFEQLMKRFFTAKGASIPTVSQKPTLQAR